MIPTLESTQLLAKRAGKDTRGLPKVPFFHIFLLFPSFSSKLKSSRVAGLQLGFRRVQTLLQAFLVHSLLHMGVHHAP